MAKRTIVGITSSFEPSVRAGKGIRMPTLDGSIRGPDMSHQQHAVPSKTARARHPMRRARRTVLREAAANGRQLG